MRMHHRAVLLAAATAAAAATIGAGAAPAVAHGTDGTASGTARTNDQYPAKVFGSGISPFLVAEMMLATYRFHDPAAAEAAGYNPTDVCRADMGQHWINWDNLFDGVNDPRKPDVLLYEPRRDGLRLVGVEWMQFDADQDLTTDSDRPDLGGVPFDGPMLGHSEGEPIHYDLHFYIWKYNPDGLTASHNPRVHCPS